MKKTFIFVLLLTFLGGVPTPVAADSSTWTLTGSMSVVRRDHTATLLTNGKVLIVGSTPAELYDPATGVFSPTTGSTVFSHGSLSTASRLADGTVLIVGGTGAPTSAEIYDPSTDTFSSTGGLNAVHTAHSATLLPDGTVLIAAGQDNVGPQTHAVAELYDPPSGTFTLTDSLKDHRSGHTATLLPDGQVLITGGTQTTTPPNGIALSSAELYDPTAKTFSFTDSMDFPRIGHTATLLASGKVLVAGALASASAELYDSGTDTFALTGSMNEPRGAHTASLMPSGQVLIAGGFVATGPVTTNSAELYDPASETFTPTASMVVPRQQHTATVLLDGRALVTGGFSPTVGGNVSSAELFTISVTLTFSPTETDQNFSFDGGNNTFTIAFDQVDTTFDLTVTAVDTVPGSLAAAGRLDVLGLPPDAECVPYATSLLCVVYEIGEPLPQRGTDFCLGAGPDCGIDIYIGFLPLGDAGISGRISGWSEFVVVSPGVEFAKALLQAPGPGTGNDFTLDITTDYLPNGLPIKELGTFCGILPPVRADGSSDFKLGRTVPLKFKLSRLPDCSGDFITDAVVFISSIVGTPKDGNGGILVEDFEASGGANTGNLFRFDPDSMQYVFNLSTKTEGFASGTTQEVTIGSDKFLPVKIKFGIR